LWWFIVLAGSSLFTGPWAEAHGGKLKLAPPNLHCLGSPSFIPYGSGKLSASCFSSDFSGNNGA